MSGAGIPLDDPVSESVAAATIRRTGEVAAELADLVYVIQLEPEFRFEFISDSVTEVVGYTPQQHYDDPALGQKLLDPRDAAELARAMALPEGAATDLSVRWMHADGRTVWTRHHVRKERRRDGSLVVIGAVRDETAQHRALLDVTAARDELERFSRLVSNVVFRAGADQKITWISDSITALLGWEPKELVGRRLSELLADDVRAETEAARRDFYADPESHAASFTARLRTRDDGYRWVTAQVESLVSGGEPRGLVGGLTDVTDLVLAREQSGQAEERARLLAESATDVVVFTDADRRVQWVSPGVTRALGWAPQDLVGTRIVDLSHPDDQVHSPDRDRLYSPSAVGSYEVTLRLRTKAGGWRWMSERGTAVHSDDGTYLGVVLGFRDVGELVLAREQLRSVLDSMLDPLVFVAAVRERDGRVVDMRYLDLNAPAAELMRRSPDSIIGKRATDLFPGESTATFIRWCSEALAGGAAVTLDEVALSSQLQGGLRTFDVRVVPRPDDTVIITWRDVSERAQLSHELAEREALWRRTVRDSAIGMCLVASDGSFEDVNDALCEFFGYPAEVLKTRTWQELTHPDDLAVDVAKVEQVLDGEIDSYRLVKRYRHADGHFLVGDLAVSGVRDDDGNFLHFVSQIVDITEATRLRDEVEESRRTYRMLAEYSGDVILQVALDGTIRWASPSAHLILGWEPADLVGRRNTDLVHPEDLEWFMPEAARLAREGVASSLTARFACGDGSYRWLDAVGRQVPAEDGREAFRVVRLRDVTDQVAETDRLTYRAHHDPLTGLLNRDEVFGRINELRLHTRRTGARTALVYIDIDGLKVVNDTYGHAAGDEYIQTVSRRMGTALRDDDLVARLGGDELLVALGGLHTMDDALRVAGKIANEVRVDAQVGGATITPSVSMGVAMIGDEEDLTAAIARADHAMYRGKRRAPGGITVAPDPGSTAGADGLVTDSE